MSVGQARQELADEAGMDGPSSESEELDGLVDRTRRFVLRLERTWP